MLCVECGSMMRECCDPIEVKYREEDLTVRDINHYVCDACGEVVFDAEDGRKYDAAIIKQYAALHDLLSPDEIRSIRKRAGLNQREFEKVLGVSTPSVSRWETGRVIQSKPVDLLMRAYRDNSDLLKSRMEQCEIRTSDSKNNVIHISQALMNRQKKRENHAPMQTPMSIEVMEN